MKQRLLDLLCCPRCGGPFALASGSGQDGRIEEGSLSCGCGSTVPVRAGIPRLAGASEIAATGRSDRFLRAQRQTQQRFGLQWQHFSQMTSVFQGDLERYLSSRYLAISKGMLGLDAGCGFGRHAYYLAERGAEIVGVDFSEAIDAASRTLAERDNVHLTQADLYHLPFRPQTFDFIYSIGVLHHLPDPEAGFRALVPLLKPGGSIFIWVYSNTRVGINAILETLRRLTTRLPPRALLASSYVAGAIDFGGFVLPYRFLRSLPWIGPRVERLSWPRVKVYSRFPFDVMCADWFDRLAAPRRSYYDAESLQRWLTAAGLVKREVTPTGLYGWRAYGETPAHHYTRP